MEFVHGFLEVWSMMMGFVPSVRGAGAFSGIISVLAVWFISIRIVFFVVGKVFRMIKRRCNLLFSSPATQRPTK